VALRDVRMPRVFSEKAEYSAPHSAARPGLARKFSVDRRAQQRGNAGEGRRRARRQSDCGLEPIFDADTPGGTTGNASKALPKVGGRLGRAKGQWGGFFFFKFFFFFFN